MASSCKSVVTKHSSSGSLAHGSKRSGLAFSPAALLMSAMAIPTPTAGMGFNFLPPLPIISKPFGFLKHVDLRTVGLDLGDIPVKSTWELELFKPVVEQTRSEGLFESGVDFGVLETRSKPVPDLGGFETGVKTVSDLGKAEP